MLKTGNFQRWAYEQGKAFADEALRALKYAGFEIAEREVHLPDVGITLDAITNNIHGVPMAWEFKGSLRGSRPGLLRTDTAKKAVANGWLFQQSEYANVMMPSMLVMTSHIPITGDAARMIDVALQQRIIFRVVDSRDSRTLCWLADATEDELRLELTLEPTP